MLIPYSPPNRQQGVEFHGLTIVIETPRFSMRHGPGWLSSPPADYGYVLATRGADGDEMDCYLGPNPSSELVFVVDQNMMDGSGTFDEHKCMLGYDSADHALMDYLSGHTDGHKIFRGMTPMRMNTFKAWLKNGDVSKPVGR